MTISTTSNRKNYTATAGQTVFAYDFLIHANTDLEVYVNGTQKTLTVDYTVSGVDDPAGGNVTFLSGLAVDDSVVILRILPLTSLINYVAADAFPPATANDGFEKVIMIAQQLQEHLNRTISLAKTSLVSNVTIGGTATRAGKGLKWNSAGTAIEEYAIVSTDIANPITTEGDLLQGGTAGAAERLGIGSAGQVLTVTGGKAAWGAAPTSSITTKGDLIRGDNTGVEERFGIGSSGNVLSVVAGQAAWAAPATDPTITDFTNANHTHASTAQGGALPNSAIAVHKNGTNQTAVASATETLITWSTEAVDRNNDFASNKWTPQISKPIILCAKLRLLALENATYVEVRIIKNGATTLASQRGISANTTMTVDSGTAVAVDVPNGTTDYYEVYVYHNGTGTKSIDGTRDVSYFCGAVIF